jgi:hypothetical protein
MQNVPTRNLFNLTGFILSNRVAKATERVCGPGSPKAPRRQPWGIEERVVVEAAARLVRRKKQSVSDLATVQNQEAQLAALFLGRCSGLMGA